MKKPICPLCNTEMVMIMSDDSQNKEPQIFALNELVRQADGTYGINRERGLPVVMALCETCGYLMPFSAHKLNLE
ncbi:hypothetical protein [Desulforamulus hydrothermalis]|uniref:Uncharacterized protein n=1 Tax=Desulforamulus hydrothermalis Lam5 = DSM 18033 TaxID=1121428 RepID=K8EAG4_9FIRM|nr:hypothetical protein [Desulforamulus hydrothermalis]CCO08613.1 conserved hypothetical protein [Desulforamulus hydrothermalis Lam5 = DSM 18033]SHH01155.1 hypothetical protein SAMN02745177_01109 [Desulforamulus hydrothermalis Lam5 = DSM 18033]